MFSIIIPTLNEEKFLPKLLISLTRQTVKNFEVIVVDGASKDKTVKLAKRFVGNVPNLKIIELNHAGVSHQRNIGAKEAKSDWFVFVDADSILFPNFIERIGEYIATKNPKCFTTWYKPDGDNPANAITGLFLNMALEASYLIDKPWTPGPLTVVCRDVYNLAGGYDETATFGEDHDFGVIIRKRGIRSQILREMLYIYSLRRFRKEGTIKVLERAMIATLLVVVTGKGPKHMKGFVGGGGVYNGRPSKKKVKIRVFAQLEKVMKKIIKEVTV